MDPTGAPKPLRLDKEYQAYPFRDVDYTELNNWVQREYLSRVKETTDDRDLLAIALEESMELTWSVGIGRKLACTVRGVQKIASLMVRKPMPYELFTNGDAINEVMNVFISHLPKPEDSKDGDEGSEGN